MSGASDTDALLVQRIRDGDSDAWSDLISRYEGRLLAFVESRIGHRGASEDVVQETFIGFLNSLPNYDGRRPLESYLFSICAYKLTDHLRREGRRPSVPAVLGVRFRRRLATGRQGRAASSIARSGERHGLEEEAIVAALREQVARWRNAGTGPSSSAPNCCSCAGWPNKNVAAQLDISEQQVANFKFDFIARLRSMMRRQGLSEDVFPELYEEEPSADGTVAAAPGTAVRTRLCRT